MVTTGDRAQATNVTTGSPDVYGELGGVICRGCGEEVFRILENRCMQCWRGAAEEHEELLEAETTLKKLQKRYPGMVSLKNLRKAKARLAARASA